MENRLRYVVGGQELGRAPALKKCPCCGGIADYTRTQGAGYRVTCSACGMQSGERVWPANAGDAWNARTSEHARIITTDEIMAFRADLTDDMSRCACWVETIEGEMRAAVLEVCTSLDGREVYECGWGDFWERDRVNAEGIRWRLWDKCPKPADREREPWGRVGYDCMSEDARAEADRIRRELDERRNEEERRRIEADRRHCLYCGQCVLPDNEARDLGTWQPFECARDGHEITSPANETCDKWTLQGKRRE